MAAPGTRAAETRKRRKSAGGFPGFPGFRWATAAALFQYGCQEPHRFRLGAIRSAVPHLPPTLGPSPPSRPSSNPRSRRRLNFNTGLVGRWKSSPSYSRHTPRCYRRSRLPTLAVGIYFTIPSRKGDWQKRGRRCDLLHCGSKEKDWHPWQQSLANVETLIRYFSQSGDLIVDLCGGGFTTAVACCNLRRRCISCDVDEQCVATGWERLADFGNGSAHSGVSRHKHENQLATSRLGRSLNFFKRDGFTFRLRVV